MRISGVHPTQSRSFSALRCEHISHCTLGSTLFFSLFALVFQFYLPFFPRVRNHFHRVSSRQFCVAFDGGSTPARLHLLPLRLKGDRVVRGCSIFRRCLWFHYRHCSKSKQESVVAVEVPKNVLTTILAATARKNRLLLFPMGFLVDFDLKLGFKNQIIPSKKD